MGLEGVLITLGRICCWGKFSYPTSIFLTKIFNSCALHLYILVIWPFSSCLKLISSILARLSYSNFLFFRWHPTFSSNSSSYGNVHFRYSQYFTHKCHSNIQWCFFSHSVVLYTGLQINILPFCGLLVKFINQVKVLSLMDPPYDFIYSSLSSMSIQVQVIA